MVKLPTLTMAKTPERLVLSWSTNHNGSAWRLHTPGFPNDWYISYNQPANSFESAVYKAQLKCLEYSQLWGKKVILEIDGSSFGREVSFEATVTSDGYYIEN